MKKRNSDIGFGGNLCDKMNNVKRRFFINFEKLATSSD